MGRYQQSELPMLMAEVDWVVVPSIWWENSPLVIQEAFVHHRPVICSDIGGMAEKVVNGASGLQFRVNDHVDLANTIRRAIGEDGLWEKLVRGIPAVKSIEDNARELASLYETLIDQKQSASKRDHSSAGRRRVRGNGFAALPRAGRP